MPWSKYQIRWMFTSHHSMWTWIWSKRWPSWPKLNNIPEEKIICSSQVVKVYVHFVTGLQRGMENINFPNRTISTPLSHTHPKKLKLPLQQERLKTTMLENEIKRMEIKFSGVEVDNEQQTKLMRMLQEV